MKWINYHHLIYFKEIAHSMSISKAAKKIGIGQPALSSQLKTLETYLGTKLFERKNRSLNLTEAGRVVLEYALKIDDLGQELIDVMDDKIFAKNIHLTVGTLDYIPKHMTCDIVDFAHKKTGAFLSIIQDSKDGLLRRLLAHELDLIISDKPLEGLKHKNIYSKKIVSRPIVAYASPKFKNLTKNFPESLNNAPCMVTTSDSKIRQDVDHFFEVNEIRPKYIAETQDTALQKILSIKGDGVIFLPKFTIKEYLQYKMLVKIGDLKGVEAEYYITYSKRMIENPALKIIIDQNFQDMRL